MDLDVELIKQLKEIKFKRDSFQKARGIPQLLVITCCNCDSFIIAYQKDGPGPLKRCYLDRIHFLKPFSNSAINKTKLDYLSCPKCSTVIGTSIIYEKENRPAFHLRQGFFYMKKINKKTWLNV